MTMKAKGTKAMDDLHATAIRKYHTLAGQLRLTPEDREALLAPYGCSSSKDMETHDLLDVCAALARELDKRTEGADIQKLRKQAMASIGAWLRESGKESCASLIKGIACRATGYRSYNKIPKERLRNLIGLFNAKTKDKRSVDALTKELEAESSAYSLLPTQQLAN